MHVTLMSAAPLFVSAMLLLLTIVAIIRALALSAAEPKVPVDLTMQVQRIRGILNFKAESAAAKPKTAPTRKSPKMSEAERARAQFSRALQSWYEAVPPTHQSIVSTKISAFLDALERLTPQLSGTDPAHGISTLNGTMGTVVNYAVTASDRDLDPDRRRPALQEALNRLLQAAGLEWIDPPRGSTYPPIDSTSPEDRTRIAGKASVRKRVKHVNTRGLRTHDGRTITEPDIEELF